MTPEDLNSLHETFQGTAWRLEARDDYAVLGADPDEGGDPEFDHFVATGMLGTPRTVENSWWMRTVAAARATHRMFERVRLVSWPFTDYTRFELASYPENTAHGENVLVLDRRRLEPADEAWAHQDFWLFDEGLPGEIVVLQRYSPAGHFLGVERAPDPAPYREVRRRALELAVPLSEYPLVSDHAGPDGEARAPAGAEVSAP